MEQDEREELRRLIAEELAHHGFRADESDENRDLLRWLKRHKEAFESAGNWTWRSVVLAILTGISVAIWEGIKHLLMKHYP